MTCRRLSLWKERSGTRCGYLRPGFTLLEVLVVASIVSLLLAIMLPGLAAARQQAQSVVCRSNIRQILLANEYYAQDSGGHYCPGAAEFRRNLHRWHGRRDKAREPFRGDGPLSAYLNDGSIRTCPGFPAEEIAASSGGFERGCGGYGYNQAYLGVLGRFHASGEFAVVDDRAGALRDLVPSPAETVAFADSAFAGATLIEYSFAEPRFHPQYADSRADPSIQFRHEGIANVGWSDGHVDGQRRTATWSSGLYPADPGRYDLGWFGSADDNSLFDLR